MNELYKTLKDLKYNEFLGGISIQVKDKKGEKHIAKVYGFSVLECDGNREKNKYEQDQFVIKCEIK